MQVSLENMSGLERRLTVQVPGQEIQDKIDSKLRELSKQVRIKGFRPGRVPMSVVRQRYGKQVRQDIVNETVQSSLAQAIRDEDLRPASMPRLDAEPQNLDGGDLEFSALIEVYPDIDSIDVSNLAIERPEAEVSDKDVEDMIETLRDQRTSWEAVERKPQAGNQVALEFSAETKDGRVPETGKQFLSFVISETPAGDLEKAVASMSPGEEKTVKLKFSDEFRVTPLAGKKAQTDLFLKSVSEGSRPEVDEAFIRSFGVEDGTLESFQAEVRNNLERELKQATSSLLKSRLIDVLLESVPGLEVPASIVRQEAAGMAARILQSQGQDVGEGQPPDPALVDQLMEPAENHVRAGLLLGELAQQNSINIDGARVRAAIETVASTYEQPAEVVQLYYGNQQLLQQVESSVLEEQVVDWVMENAKVTPSEMTFQEVIGASGGRPAAG